VLAAVIAIVVYFQLNKKTKSDSGTQTAAGVLHEREYRRFPLIKKDALSPNTYQFRFGLPTSSSKLGLPVGKHMLLRFLDEEKKPVSRPYTPVTSDDELGYFDLVIKVYPMGKMSQHLKGLPLNDTIEVRGPLGSLTYHGQGAFTIMRKDAETGRESPKEYKKQRVGMIAGGTGITPCLQIIRDVLKHPKDKTQLSLIFANVTEDDILLRGELESLTKQHSNFRVYYTLDKPTDSWPHGRGFVNAAMIQANLPEPAQDSIILMCGPDPMMKFMEKNMATLEYKADQYFVF